MDDIHEISVCDEGGGLPPDDDLRSGGGLGTKVITALASQLGGRITSGPSAMGRGSCFTVTYPPEGK